MGLKGQSSVVVSSTRLTRQYGRDTKKHTPDFSPSTQSLPLSSQQLRSISPSQTKSFISLKNISSTPSHIDLMKRFQATLKLDWQSVFTGIAVENALVEQASIHQTQNDAAFRRDKKSNDTIFCLRLGDIQYIQFLHYYRTRFPKLIKTHKRLNKCFVKITLDTCCLYNDVAPQLGKQTAQHSTVSPVPKSKFKCN